METLEEEATEETWKERKRKEENEEEATEETEGKKEEREKDPNNAKEQGGGVEEQQGLRCGEVNPIQGLGGVDLRCIENSARGTNAGDEGSDDEGILGLVMMLFITISARN